MVEWDGHIIQLEPRPYADLAQGCQEQHLEIGGVQEFISCRSVPERVGEQIFDVVGDWAI